MNTHPMNTSPETWHEMSEPMTLPALVQFDDGQCLIVKDTFAAAVFDLRGAVRWRPWVNPELPKPLTVREQDEAKAEELEGYHVSHRHGHYWREAIMEGIQYGRAAERSRFDEGVEKLISGWEARCEPWYKFTSDLRALAKGEK